MPTLAQAETRLLENPFNRPFAELERAREVVLARPREALERAIAEGQGERSVIALLHAQALGGASFRQLLEAPWFSARAQKSLPHSRLHHVRAAQASARCIGRLT